MAAWAEARPPPQRQRGRRDTAPARRARKRETGDGSLEQAAASHRGRRRRHHAGRRLHAAPVALARSVPCATDDGIARKAREECAQPDVRLSACTQRFAREFNVAFDVADAAAPGDAGRVLVMRIDGASSMGAPFIGHQGHSRIVGALIEDVEQVAAFGAHRDAMGGAFAGYTGSCSVRGRTMRALGRDVAGWPRDPLDGARPGHIWAVARPSPRCCTATRRDPQWARRAPPTGPPCVSMGGVIGAIGAGTRFQGARRAAFHNLHAYA
mgnify:CR=1 FL=1